MFSGHCGLLPEAVSVGYSLETAQGWTRDWETEDDRGVAARGNRTMNNAVTVTEKNQI